MHKLGMKLTYIGGPTALLELGGLRLLTDPTFDPSGTEYDLGAYRLRKTEGPAIQPQLLGLVDIILLSHDHHFDNLDRAGRDFLKNARRVLTTPAGAARLEEHATGLTTWQSFDIPASDGRILQVTSTPAQHGPADHDRGPVTGFVLSFADAQDDAVYVSGDTVLHEGLAEIGRRFPVKVAFLFMGAARVPEVGPWHLTLTAEEGLEVANVLPHATIVPLHFEGWTHFSESRQEIAQAFAAARLEGRLRWAPAGHEITIDL